MYCTVLLKILLDQKKVLLAVVHLGSQSPN